MASEYQNVSQAQALASFPHNKFSMYLEQNIFKSQFYYYYYFELKTESSISLKTIH